MSVVVCWMAGEAGAGEATGAYTGAAPPIPGVPGVSGWRLVPSRL